MPRENLRPHSAQNAQRNVKALAQAFREIPQTRGRSEVNTSVPLCREASRIRKCSRQSTFYRSSVLWLLVLVGPWPSALITPKTVNKYLYSGAGAGHRYP